MATFAPELRLRYSIRLGEQRDWMDDANGELFLAEAVEDLEKATGVAGGDDGRAGRFDVFDFALEKVAGHFRLDQVVDAGAATAPHALREFDELQVRN